MYNPNTFKQSKKIKKYNLTTSVLIKTLQIYQLPHKEVPQKE